MKYKPHLLCLGLVLVATGCKQTVREIRSTAAQPAISEVAVGFTNFQQMTKTAVFVDPFLAMLCRGITKEEVDQARKESGPHANTAIQVYMNKAAADAFHTNTAAYPVGAVIVKQKEDVGYDDRRYNFIRRVEAGIGGMIKRPAGYNSKHGDWEYFYFENPKKIESGRISSCVNCHDSAKATDRVFGHWKKESDLPANSRRP